jgi:hypothetical protein
MQDMSKDQARRGLSYLFSTMHLNLADVAPADSAGMK